MGKNSLVSAVWAKNLQRPLMWLLIGMTLEVSVILFHFAIDYIRFDFYVLAGYLFTSNAYLGLFASLVMCYGALSLVHGINVNKGALNWIYASAACLLLFRLMDIVNTHEISNITKVLGLGFDLDALVMNVLLIAGSLALLFGLFHALFDFNMALQQLAEMNTDLAREIEERQHSEKRARESENEMAVLINAFSSAVFLGNEMGCISVHNSEFARMWNRTGDNLTGTFLGDLMPGPLFELGRKHALKSIETGETTDFIAVYQDRHYKTSIFPVTDAQGAVMSVAVFLADLTDQLLAEKEMRLLQTAVESAAESVVVTDATGTIEYVNYAFVKQTGYTRDEAIGRTTLILESGHHEQSYYDNLWKTIREGKVWRGHFINRRKDGSLFNEDATISPIANEEGEIIHYVAVNRDVTRERELELQFHQAQKIEALGTLAGGIAHDINNVLAIVLGRSEIAAGHLPAGHPAREDLEIITRTATRSSGLIKRLLIFCRQNVGEGGPLQIVPLILDQAKIIRAYLPANIVVADHVDPDAGHIYSESGEVQQVIVNLCTNASHAMQPDGGRLNLHLDTLVLDQEFRATTGILPPGLYVRLRVCDTGCGMDEETQRHIFDPFFTTKDLGIGTGLGLPMILGSVNRAGGAINVDSKRSQGTRFDVYWPSFAGDVPEENIVTEKHGGEGRHVLVVDDMEDFRELMEINLVNHGFKVTAFSSPLSALEFFRQHADAVDIAVIDYMMPVMDGAMLADELHAIHPTVPVVLLSGYASGITNENAQQRNLSAVLNKPTATDALISTLCSLTKDAGTV